MSDFAQRTQSYPDARLFKIVREANKYAPEAVAAAEVEIKRRGLNGADFPAAPTDKPFSKVSKMLTKLAPPSNKHRPDDVIDWVDQPLPSSEAGEKYRLYLMIVIGLTGLIGVYDQWEYLKFAFGPNPYGLDYTIVLIILALLFQFAVVYLLWRKNRIGYYISAFFGAAGLIGALFLVPYLLDDYNEYGDILSFLAPTVDPITFCINLGFSIATIWLVTRKELMAILDVTRKNLIITLGLGVAYTLLTNLLFSL